MPNRRRAPRVLLLLLLPWLGAVGCGLLGTETLREPPPGAYVPPLAPIESSFVHDWNRSRHPFSGAAVIDVDGDGRLELFVGGGYGQSDALLAYEDGVLEDRIEGTGLSSLEATYGATAIDLDADGATDLIVARNDGVTLYRNTGGRFSAQPIHALVPRDSVPLHVAVGDVDRDGDGDLYVSAFVAPEDFRSAVFNDPSHGKANRLLIHEGNLRFRDVTRRSGTGTNQNTFFSLFTDLDGDGWPELVVAQNTGRVELFHNQRDGRFQPVNLATGYGFWMGIAAGDVDGDGDLDLAFSNTGSSIPTSLVRGDLREEQRLETRWLALRNEGALRFENTTATWGLGGLGFGWGLVFEDLDLDGRLDLFAAQNYVRWPIHRFFELPGKAMLQDRTRGTPSFTARPGLGLDNPFYGQSPIIADLDGDGRNDFVWLNVDGPLRAFRNTSEASFVSVVLPDDVASLDARVVALHADGRQQVRHVVTGTGLLTDQTPEVVIGLGEVRELRELRVERAGAVHRLASPPLGRKLLLSELPIE